MNGRASSRVGTKRYVPRRNIGGFFCATLLVLASTTGQVSCWHGHRGERRATERAGLPGSPLAAPPFTAIRAVGDSPEPGLRQQLAWLDSIPSCGADDLTFAQARVPEGSPGDNPGARRISLRGRLGPASGECTAMACYRCRTVPNGPDSSCPLEATREGGTEPAAPCCKYDGLVACCNGCNWDWVVLPLVGTAKPAVRLRQPGQSDVMRGGGFDCVMRRLPSREVIVTGWLAVSGDLVTEAQLCQIRPSGG